MRLSERRLSTSYARGSFGPPVYAIGFKASVFVSLASRAVYSCKNAVRRRLLTEILPFFCLEVNCGEFRVFYRLSRHTGQGIGPQARRAVLGSGSARTLNAARALSHGTRNRTVGAPTLSLEGCASAMPF